MNQETPSGEAGRGLGAAPCSAKWSNEELSWLLGEIELNAKLKESDNRKLLWLAMNTMLWKERDMIGVETEILNEVENRLYPEYDGETVTFEEWGWRTPDGDVRYLPNAEVSDGDEPPQT